MEVDQPDGQHHDGQSHVHFPEEQTVQHESEIVVKRESDSSLSAHLGFLQVHHHYEIKFSVQDSLGEDLTSDPLQNLHVKVAGVMPREDGEGHDLTLSFHAYKEKLIQEEIVLVDVTDSSKQLVLRLHARVLGKGKGTPSLRNGIHCTSVDPEYDSEHSDWQGFD